LAKVLSIMAAQDIGKAIDPTLAKKSDIWGVALESVKL